MDGRLPTLTWEGSITVGEPFGSQRIRSERGHVGMRDIQATKPWNASARNNSMATNAETIAIAA